MIQTAHSKEFVYLNPRGNINLVHFRGHDNFNPIQGGHFWGCSWMGGGAGGKKAPSLKFVTYPAIMKLGSYTLPREDPKNI